MVTRRCGHMVTQQRDHATRQGMECTELRYGGAANFF